MSVENEIAKGDAAEFGRFTHAVGQFFLGNILESVTEDSTIEFGDGTQMTVQRQGIAFRVGHSGTPVSIDRAQVEALLAQPLEG